MIKFTQQTFNRTRIITDDLEVYDFLETRFTIPNPKHRFNVKIPKFINLISALRTFNSGLFWEIYEVVRKRFPSHPIEVDPEVKKVVVPFSYKNVELVDPENDAEFIYKPYQEDAIVKGLTFGRGLLVYPTGSGKSLVIYGLIKNISKYHFNDQNFTTLILVPSTQLVIQMYEDIQKYGCPIDKISMFSAECNQPVFNNIIISNRDWLEGHANELPPIDVLIVDECHQLKSGNVVTKYVNSLRTNIRFGLTGTLPKEIEDRWSLIGSMGKVLAEIKPMELQSLNHIAKCKIVNVHFLHASKPEAPPEFLEIEDEKRRIQEQLKARFPLEWKFIESSVDYNRIVVDFVTKLSKNTIILFDHNAHGESIRDQFNTISHLKQVYFVNGQTPLSYRENVRKDMEISDNCVCIANTACFKQGINIKNIFNIVFMFAHGKGNTKIIQAIGRALRKLDTKVDGVTIYDLTHNTMYSQRHFKIREEFYKEYYGIQEHQIKKFQFRIK